MTLKNAALLALVGMILLTIEMVVHLIIDVWGVLNGVVSAVRLLASLIYALASVGVTVFFWVFHKGRG
jgi:hypothetical protein